VPFAGHVPSSIRVAEAVRAGQRSIEHADALNLECSADGESIRAWADSGTPPPFDGYIGLMRILLRDWSLDYCADAIATLGEAERTWFVPTLAVTWATVHSDSVLMDTAAVAGLSDRIQGWQTRSAATAAADHEVGRELFSTAVQVTGELHRSGMRLLAGTDAATAWVIPGYSLHTELALLGDAGISPLEALQAATLEPARFLESTDSLGTIEPGKLADLVLLDANPLEDIRHTRRIRAVISDGRFFDRAALDALLAAARQGGR